MVVSALRRLASGALARLPERQRLIAYDLIKRLIPGKREVLAARHLRGSGIEIGAMHNPLKVPAGVTVRYVDYVSREDNLERFSEIRGFELVRPDFIEDGFTLPSFQASSVDFLIANHVLEHTDNVLKTLVRWAEVLRPRGVLFLSVPLAERCFDRGRPITPLGHFISDYGLVNGGHLELFREHTREHYAHWLAISLPAIVAEQGAQVNPDAVRDLQKTADDLLAEQAEIHFHTFSMASLQELLQHFCTQTRPDFRLLTLQENGIEAIAVLERS